MKKGIYRGFAYCLILLLIVGFAGCVQAPAPQEDAAASGPGTMPEAESEAAPNGVGAADGYVYNPELTEDRIVAWALGCSAILATSNGKTDDRWDPYQFGMLEKNEDNATLIQRVLSNDWDISNRDELISTINSLAENGQNKDFVEAYRWVASLSDADMQKLIEMSKGIDVYMWPQTKRIGDKWGDKQIKAWDWFRMVHLAGWGYVAGYLERDEAYDLMKPAIELIRGTFSSWDDANENYLDGYAWWSRSNPDDPYNSYTYQVRKKAYADLKAYPPSINIFDPILWPDYVPGAQEEEPDYNKVFSYDDNGDGTCTITGLRWEIEGALNLPTEIDGLKVTAIGYSAFKDETGLTGNLTIPKGVSDIERMAFSGCTGFTGGLIIPEGMETIGQSAFSGCTGFTGGLSIPEGMETIQERTFYGCSGLMGQIDIPASVTNIEYMAFGACTGLNAFAVSGQNLSYSSSDGILFNKDGSTLILAPEGLQKNNFQVPEGVKLISAFAFSNCVGITGTITIPGSVGEIKVDAFSGCTGFSELNILNGVTFLNKDSFVGCSSLKKVTMPESMTNLGSGVFANCSSLSVAEFQGDAINDFSKSVFLKCADDFKILYNPAKTGWSTPEWNGYPCYPK